MPLRSYELFAVGGAFFLVAAWLFLRFNANGVQSGDAWIAYLPGAIALERLDLQLFRESLAFGYGRPAAPPALIAIVHLLTPGLNLPQSAHLLTVGSGLVVSLVCYCLLRRSLGAAWSFAGTAMIMVAPGVLRSWVYTTPDMLFTAFVLGLAWAVLVDRPYTALACFGALALTRSNGLAVLPAVVAYLLLHETSRRRRLTLTGAAIGLAILANSLVRWGKPRTSLLGSPASQWHPSIFVEGSKGWSLQARLDWSEPMQYLLLPLRAAVTAPADLFSHSWSDAGVESVAHLAFFLLVSSGLVVFLARARRRSAPRSHFIVLAGLLMLYGPMALFHWETRYMLPLFAGLGVVGFGAIASRLPDSAGWGAAAAAVLVGGVMLNALSSEYPVRTSLDLDDSGYVHRLAQEESRTVLSRVEAGFDTRPVSMQGCETMPLQYFNYVRFLEYPGLIRCTGWRFHREVAADEIDAWIYTPGAKYRTEPERTLSARAVPIVQVGERAIARVGDSDGPPSPYR